MDAIENRRQEARLRFHWPIWYSGTQDRAISQGQMVDVSSRAAAFTCYTRDFCPGPDQKIHARFSVPQYGEDDSFGVADFVRTGSVFRIDRMNDLINRVVVQFDEPLHFKPGEQVQVRDDIHGPVAAIAV